MNECGDMGPDWELARQLDCNRPYHSAFGLPRLGFDSSMSSHSKRRAESEEVVHKKR
jgi:hypothetical protein